MGTPCVNVPGLADLAGLPLGMQVIGQFGSDRATLEAALFVETALRPPGLRQAASFHASRLQMPKECAGTCKRARRRISPACRNFS